MSEMTETSIASRIQKESEALRTTIPQGVKASLKIKEGDMLAWEVEIENNEIIAKVRKAKERKK